LATLSFDANAAARISANWGAWCSPISRKSWTACYQPSFWRRVRPAKKDADKARHHEHDRAR
jgi:hypothetical protein